VEGGTEERQPEELTSGGSDPPALGLSSAVSDQPAAGLTSAAGEQHAAGLPSGATAQAAPKRVRFVRWSYRWVWVVIVVGVIVTTGLALLSAHLNSSNEQHLLRLRSKEVASTLTAALPDLQTPLGAAVTLADITGADAAKFSQFAASYVGTGRQFISMSVWRTGHLDQGPVTGVGAQPELGQAAGGAPPILRAAAQRRTLTVLGLLHATQRRIAYVYAGSRPGPFLVEAEQALQPSSYTRLPPNSAYSNLNIAVYIARRPIASRLLLTTDHRMPLPGKRAVSVIPFGSSWLTVQISARQPLGGSLPNEMPWVIVIIGALLTSGASVLTFRLIWGGRRVQKLAAENRQLYAEQREIAQSLQRALLPDKLPEIEGLRVAALLHAGAPGVEIGGDWYDMIRLGSGRLLLVVGDVSGRGIRAAAAMASLRSAIQYAAQTDPPEVFLPRLSRLRSLREHGQLATILCMVIDLQGHSVSVTSAGHLPPLLVHPDHTEFLRPEVGLPIGVDPDCTYVPRVFTVIPGASLFGFTDGLVERHGESLDEGLERLRAVAVQATGDLEQMMATIIDGVRSSEAVDDTAIAAVQWLER
jgi:hypothetical protein